MQAAKGDGEPVIASGKSSPSRTRTYNKPVNRGPKKPTEKPENPENNHILTTSPDNCKCLRAVFCGRMKWRNFRCF